MPAVAADSHEVLIPTFSPQGDGNGGGFVD